jgi:hypothetical protein
MGGQKTLSDENFRPNQFGCRRRQIFTPLLFQNRNLTDCNNSLCSQPLLNLILAAVEENRHPAPLWLADHLSCSKYTPPKSGSEKLICRGIEFPS